MQVRKIEQKVPEQLHRFTEDQKLALLLLQQMMVPVRMEATLAFTNSEVEATPTFESRDALLVSPATVTLTEAKTMLQVTNPHKHTYTLYSCLVVANFKVMTDSTSRSEFETKTTRENAALEQPPSEV